MCMDMVSSNTHTHPHTHIHTHMHTHTDTHTHTHTYTYIHGYAHLLVHPLGFKALTVSYYAVLLIYMCIPHKLLLLHICTNGHYHGNIHRELILYLIDM